MIANDRLYKKARERFLLKEVAALSADFPSGDLDDHEGPDFLVQEGSRTLGIEIMDYIRGQSSGESVARRNEVLWQRIANVARDKFESTHPIPLWVLFQWGHRYPRLADVQRLGASASSLIAEHIPQEPSTSSRVGYEELENTPLEEFVSSINVSRVRNQKQSGWSFVGAAFIGLQVDEIQSLISSKDKRRDAYLKKCASVWLIIVADGTGISSNVSLSDNVLGHRYHSQFERVLFYDRPNQKVVPLLIH